jgi:diamine N-acetyltransferase
MAEVTLREITRDTVRTIIDLAVSPEQEQFVAPVAVSIAQAHFEPRSWFRAIYADEEPVGFVMLFEAPDGAEGPYPEGYDGTTPLYFLWRFLIDARHQGRGFGRTALELTVDRVRSLPGARELLVSWVPEPGGPEAFYRSAGFTPTGDVFDGEVVARLPL